MKNKELINELAEQLASVKQEIIKLKNKYYNEELDTYDSFQMKYKIGFYEGQEMILEQVLKDLRA